MQIPIALLNIDLLGFVRKDGILFARVEYEDGDRADVSIECSQRLDEVPDGEFIPRTWGAASFFVGNLIDHGFIRITGTMQFGDNVRFQRAALTDAGRRLLEQN